MAASPRRDAVRLRRARAKRGFGNELVFANRFFLALGINSRIVSLWLWELIGLLGIVSLWLWELIGQLGIVSLWLWELIRE